MKKKAGNKRSNKPAGIRRPGIISQELSSDLRIVLIEQGPLRKQAGRDARKHMEKVAALEGELSEYKRTILPEFSRWQEEHLGELLTEERSLLAKIDQLDFMIETAYDEAWMSGISPGAAFRELEKERKEAEEMHRAREERGRSHAEGRDSTSEEDPRHGEEASSQWTDPDEGFSEEERVFRTYLRMAHGINPDSMPKRAFQRACDEFHRMREQQNAGGAFAGKRRGGKESAARLKELYRVLVRRLHPDLNRSSEDALRSKMWADLQEAYARGDLEKMEILVVMTDIHAGEDEIKATLHHIREVARHMERKLREIRALLRDARKTPAWEFWKSKDRNLLAIRSRAEAEKRIQGLRADLAMMEKEIEKLTSKKKSSSKKNRKSGGSFEDLMENLFAQF
jgi:hypothetical protein